MSYRSFSLVPGLYDDMFSDRFKQIDNMFSRLTGEKPISDIPSYDLIQKNENNYQLIIDTAGYKEENLDILVHNNKLTITGKYKENTDNKENYKWLHKGIKKNNFSLSFNLDNRIKVKQAKIILGLLTLDFEYEIPEQEKPRKVEIINEKK
ncbi:Hsp20 family protein [Buchnera aphidicola (Pemphigus obesinymphae)]|uniref:Hsp20 family protein n=1 Tax=Buchnera aphidicola TaxID=9 RepID=UPI002237AFC2|nr:Hsp20 family protein [Buchnera aphidicola]MCW5196847.1 Hsp20 family protein [Buchnera aphidicola (Pemphigus obesinymphae)]MCW5196870.1 Hsp20 family protein [Buchnera aphidicola (Pemphigus obesinymphae)]